MKYNIYTETRYDQLQLGDWIDATHGIAEVVEITDKTVKLAYFTCRVRFGTPKEYSEFNKAFKSHGTEWDGGVHCSISGNESLFQYGLNKRENKFSKFRGVVRPNMALKMKNKKDANWGKDFYLG
jgi:hypothetical protein